MPDKVDPFDAALSSLEDGASAESGDETAGDAASGSADPFDAAMQAMDGLGDDPGADGAGKKAAADPFDMALQSMESGESEPIVDQANDPFAAALEVAKTEHKVASAQKTGDGDSQELDLDFLMEIKLDLTFEVGRTKMYISDLLSLGQGSVIELHRLVGEELELFVNGQLLATGEVVVVNEKFGARITKIISPEERINYFGPQSVGFY